MRSHPEAQRAGVKIDRGCSDGMLLVEGDAAQLRDAFLNLAQNAIQAMPKGGRLTINCAAIPNRRVRVRVEDTGVGIAPENLTKIFDLYYTTKRAGHGDRLVAGLSHGPDSQRRDRRRIDGRGRHDVYRRITARASDGWSRHADD